MNILSSRNQVEVTDEEIRTALHVLRALKTELKAHTKRRMDRIPNNVAWNERATFIDFDYQQSMGGILRLQLELKHWIKRRVKKAQR